MASTTLPGVLLKGVAGSRPAANAVAAGTLYSATDTGAITQSDGVSTWSPWATGGVGTPAVQSNFPCQGRLTLTTAVPVTTSDVTAATTLYFTPFRGNQISTYSGSAWTLSTFTEKSITLASLTAGLPYDVFIVDSTLALELVAWTNATTRATALAVQDGILCKSGTLTRRYLGTICIKATGQSEDSLLNRFVWNYYNRLQRPLQVFDGTNTWTYATAAWRQANAAAGNKVEYVCGVSEDLVVANVQGAYLPTGTKTGSVGIGIDSTSANSAQQFIESYFTGPTDGSALLAARYRGWPGIGYHYVAWLEYARTGATSTFIGDNGQAADMQSGLLAEVWA
jgi:hypothetical protein